MREEVLEGVLADAQPNKEATGNVLATAMVCGAQKSRRRKGVGY